MAKMVRRNVALLARQLHDPEIMGDYFQQRALLGKILSFASQGEDLTAILPSMVKLLAHPDLCVKKVAGEVLMQHSAGNAEMVLLAINTLVQDASDSSPMVRGLALRTLSSLQQESVTEHVERAVSAGLSDSSAYVRRSAVLACVRLHKKSPSSIQDTGVIDRLYSMIRDSDPIVVVNCLTALEEILSGEGGIVINKNIAHYLLSKLHSYPTWVQVQILESVKKYQPGSEDELFDILNVVDGCLEHNSPAVVTTAILLFMGLLENLPHLQTEIFKRAKPTIISHLGSGNAELSVALIDLISGSSKEVVSHFSDSYQSFLCKNKDPYYLKSKKIALLPCLVTEENGSAILEELSLYCIDSSPDVSLQAMRAVGILQQEQSSLSDACKQKLIGFCHSSSPHILSNVLQVVQDLVIQDDGFWERFTSTVYANQRMLTDSSGKASLLYVLGEHGHNSMEAYLVLEECVEDYSQSEHNRDMKIQLLTALSKMFLQHPAECQGLLGVLLEEAMSDTDLEVQNHAKFLYALLASGVDTARSVLFGKERGSL